MLFSLQESEQEEGLAEPSSQKNGQVSPLAHSKAALAVEGLPAAALTAQIEDSCSRQEASSQEASVAPNVAGLALKAASDAAQKGEPLAGAGTDPGAEDTSKATAPAAMTSIFDEAVFNKLFQETPVQVGLCLALSFIVVSG